MLIFRRSYCIITASGIVTICKRPYSTSVESGLQSALNILYGIILYPPSFSQLASLRYISNYHRLIFVSLLHAVLSKGFSINILYAFLFSSFPNSTPLIAGYLHTIFLSFYHKCNEKVGSSGTLVTFTWPVRLHPGGFSRFLLVITSKYCNGAALPWDFLVNLSQTVNFWLFYAQWDA